MGDGLKEARVPGGPAQGTVGVPYLVDVQHGRVVAINPTGVGAPLKGLYDRRRHGSGHPDAVVSHWWLPWPLVRLPYLAGPGQSLPQANLLSL